MEVLNILYICITLIHIFLMYYLVNQTILELHLVQLVLVIFHCGHPSKFDIVLFLRSNYTKWYVF